MIMQAINPKSALFNQRATGSCSVILFESA